MHIKLHPASRELTAFTVDSNHYQYRSVCFGMKDSPSAFQSIVTQVLAGMEGVSAYIDDILLTGSSFEEHLDRLEEVLIRLREAELSIKLSKCQLFRNKIEFLGHEVSLAGIRPLKSKIAAIQELAPPSTVRQVRQLLGLFGYYRKFVKDYSRVAKPITDLLQGHTEASVKRIVWPDAADAALKLLKKELSDRVLLSFPDYSYPLDIHCDASSIGIGGVLSQVIEGDERPLFFFSRVLSDCETRYHSLELECLSVIWSLRQTRQWTLGHPVRIMTDCRSLIWLLTTKHTLARLVRWTLEVAAYDFEINFVKGKLNKVSDALSRLKRIRQNIDEEEENEIKGTPLMCLVDETEESTRSIDDTDEPPISAIYNPFSDEVNVHHAQVRDELCRFILMALKKPHDRVLADQATKALKRTFRHAEFEVVNKLLYRIQPLEDGFGGRLRELRQFEPSNEKYAAPIVNVIVEDVNQSELEREGYAHPPRTFVSTWDKRRLARREIATLPDARAYVPRMLDGEGPRGASEGASGTTPLRHRRAGAGAQPMAMAVCQPQTANRGGSVSEDTSRPGIRSLLNFPGSRRLDECPQPVRTLLGELPGNIPEGRVYLGDRDGFLDACYNYLNPQARMESRITRNVRLDNPLGSQVLSYTPDETTGINSLVCLEDDEDFKASVDMKDAHISRKLYEGLGDLSARNCIEHRLADFHLRYQLVIPRIFRPYILAVFHDVNSLGAHRSADKMLYALQRIAYWPEMKRDVADYVRSCEICAAYKAHAQWSTPIQQWKIPEHPNDRIHIDLTGQLDRSSAGHLYILVVVCAFSKFVTLIPLKTKTAKEVCHQLVTNYFNIFGPPRSICSDLGSEFVSNVLKSIATHYGVDHVFIARKHPSSNGQAERFVGIVKNVLRLMVQGDVRNWHQSVSYAAFALNTAYNHAVKDSPYFIVFLRDPFIPLCMYQPGRNLRLSPDDAMYDVIDTQRKIYRAVEHQLGENFKHMERKRKRSKLRDIKIGDRVYIAATPVPYKPLALQCKMSGPWRVIGRKSAVIVTVRRILDGAVTDTHLDECLVVPERNLLFKDHPNVRKPFPWRDFLADANDESDDDSVSNSSDAEGHSDPQYDATLSQADTIESTEPEPSGDNGVDETRSSPPTTGGDTAASAGPTSETAERNIPAPDGNDTDFRVPARPEGPRHSRLRRFVENNPPPLNINARQLRSRTIEDE